MSARSCAACLSLFQSKVKAGPLLDKWGIFGKPPPEPASGASSVSKMKVDRMPQEVAETTAGTNPEGDVLQGELQSRACKNCKAGTALPEKTARRPS